MIILNCVTIALGCYTNVYFPADEPNVILFSVTSLMVCYLFVSMCLCGCVLVRYMYLWHFYALVERSGCRTVEEKLSLWLLIVLSCFRVWSVIQHPSKCHLLHNLWFVWSGELREVLWCIFKCMFVMMLLCVGRVVLKTGCLLSAEIVICGATCDLSELDNLEMSYMCMKHICLWWCYSMLEG